MTKRSEEAFLQEAIRIGDELLARSERDGQGISWQTMGLEPDMSLGWNKSDSMYTGVAGIILFFIELHKQTDDPRYHEAILMATDWVVNFSKENPTDHYAFFTGRMGVVYTLIKVSKFTGDETYLQEAIRLARDCESSLKKMDAVDDLINGTSGTLLGLLHLHAAVKEDWVIKSIDKFTDHLLDRAHVGPVGLYWDRSEKNIRGLCGFSHGASGIGYVFLELGHYLQNENLYWVSEQAFSYENRFYDPVKNNWPDFRKGIFDDKTLEEHKRAYLEGNRSFFTTPGDMVAWCHGAPGIGLSRLRALELLRTESYRSDMGKAVEKTREISVDKEDGKGSFTVCHGHGGNAMLFLEAYRQFGKEEYWDLAKRVGEQALNVKGHSGIYNSGFAQADRQEDYSLFMGNAGIGYFYLQLLEPTKVPSILKPDVSDVFKGSLPESLRTTRSKIKERILTNTFPKTIPIYKTGKESQVLLDLEREEGSDGKWMHTFVEKLGSNIQEKGGELLRDIFSLESSKLKLDQTTSSNSYLYIKNYVIREQNQSLLQSDGSEALLEKNFALNSDVQLLETQWDWVSNDKDWKNNTDRQAEEYEVLLLSTPEADGEYALTPFSFVFFSYLQETQKGIDLMKKLLGDFEVSTPEEERDVREAVMQQLQEGLNNGLVMVVE